MFGNGLKSTLLLAALTGLLVGLASCFVVAQGSNLGQNVGSGKELAVIAAVVIGGTSIMGLMMLAAGRGTSIEVKVEGAEAEPLAEALRSLVADRFGEPS